MTTIAANPNIDNPKPESFTLSDIASWQLNQHSSPVDLPPLQRGFVWKVNQIEALWDSLLRGFPIGSFLLSKSENEKLFLLDGQQRATSIAIGFYNPWELPANGFWSLKDKVPVIWIDLAPKEMTATQKFVLRVVTQSHPWGYQRVNHANKLSVSDRRSALEILRKNPKNDVGGYIKLSKENVFPYDADMPVPLSFLLKSISECTNDCNDNGNIWKNKLISLCEQYLPIDCIRTKHNRDDNFNYLERLKSLLYSDELNENIFHSVNHLRNVVIPGIVVKKEILKADDEQIGEDPTLFVRLNSSGTRIAGEELIYSIYKASFPEAKGLVEGIGASFVAPSLVISLVSRLAYAEWKETYPYPISVNDFRKRIQDDEFKGWLNKYIGASGNYNEEPGKAKRIFDSAFEILLSKSDVEVPPVLVKSLVKSSPDLFLLLLLKGNPLAMKV